MKKLLHHIPQNFQHQSNYFVFKKFISLIMAFFLCLNLYSTAYASLIATDSTEYITDENGNIINPFYTIELVDELMQERVRALAENDNNKVVQITQQLANIGGRPSTYQEIAEVAGEKMAIQAYGQKSNSTSIDNYIYFETYYSNIAVNGKTYRVRRVYATPGRYTDLYHRDVLTSDQVEIDLPSGVAAGIKTAGLAAITGASYEVGFVATLYDIFSSVISGLTGTTVITDIGVSYDCSLFEHCVFLSFESGGTWVEFAISSYAAGTISSNYDYVDYSVTPPALRMTNESHYVEQFVDSSHYNMAEYLLTSFLTSGQKDTSTQIKRFAIYSGGDADNDNDLGTYVGSLPMYVPRSLLEFDYE